MQGKSFVKLFTGLLLLICVYLFSFTWYTNKVEKDAKVYSKGDLVTEKFYIDSIAKDTLPIIGNYYEAKSKELNLGLDLKGGINVVLQVSIKDILNNLSENSTNEIYLDALKRADEAQKNSSDSYLVSFFKSFDAANTAKETAVPLAAVDIFGNKQLSEEISYKSTNVEVQKVLRTKIEAALKRSFNVLRSRVDQFGVTQPNIQPIENTGRILVELPGVKDENRVKKLLASTARLEFWEVVNPQAVLPFFSQLDAYVAQKEKAKTSSVKEEVKKEGEAPKEKATTSELDKLANEVTEEAPKGLTSLFTSVGNFNVLATAKLTDTAKINKYLFRDREVRKLLPANLRYVKFSWAVKSNGSELDLYAVQGNAQNEPPLDGDAVQSASKNIDQFGRPEVSMKMNSNGSKKWADLTTRLAGKASVAVVLDNLVYTAPRVNEPITGGSSSISGDFSLQEVDDLVNVLKAGKLPASAKIIQSAVVGPSLGKKSIKSGLISFAVALGLVLVWMILYYSGAGIYADIALALNVIIILGVLISIHGVLTLPGIAGIVLTIGMSVDANVIVFERIREELNKGKSLKSAVALGFSYKGAWSSILDANVTTLLTAIILFILGSGPIKGFATTLIIGIFSSVFCAMLVTRLLIDNKIEKNKDVKFWTGMSKSLFQSLNVDFLSKRKITYGISAVLVVAALGSLLTQGLHQGVDFSGGRTFTVKFEKNVSPEVIKTDLAKIFIIDGKEVAPEVKTFGGENQVKITTAYKVDQADVEVDNEINQLLYKGLKPYLPKDLAFDKFTNSSQVTTAGITSSLKVGPTIADDIKEESIYAILLSLFVVFIYILIRFRKWQFSLGAVAAVFHDVIITLGIFSIADGLLPFSLEIDQAFIAAILTVIGYSLNDTVVVFDRIREFMFDNPNMPFGNLVNKALNTTLSRTINTSLTTFFVLLVIFIFGGENIRGFMFALMVGVVVGTYSSLFVATPIMYDSIKNKLKTRKK